MTFTSLEFPFFFLLVLIARQLARGVSMHTWVLLAASYAFFMSASVAGVLLILLTSTVDYHVGRALGATDDLAVRKRWLLVSLCSNLGMLGFFKYTNFFIDNVNLVAGTLGASFAIPAYAVMLPPGISYFTFTSLSYVLDVYYERVEPTRRPGEYLLYVAYFPKLLAGPIVRAGDFLSQVRTRVRATAADVEVGIAYFLIGAVKKVVIADQLSGHVDLIFSAPGQYDALTLVQGALGYSIQIYCDFSGYSDMAIGIARMMGLRLPENFAMPYSAVSITEFWRRWHITLSNWFRDYVFMPLEMATMRQPHPNLRASLNLLVTMALCGLWHGASWNFVFWGGLHGSSLAVNRAWRVWRPKSRTPEAAGTFIGTLGSRVLTLGVVVIGWIFFRAESWAGATEYLGGIILWRQDGIRLLSPYILAALVVVFIAHLALDKDRNLAEEIPQGALPVRVLGYSSLVLLLTTLGASESAPFLYFRF